jgi:proteasome-associated ATPase
MSSKGSFDVAAALRPFVYPDEDVPLEERVAALRFLRDQSLEISSRMDGYMLEQVCRLKDGLEEARKMNERARHEIDRLTAPPMHPAVFLGCADMLIGSVGMVLVGGARRVVSFAADIDPGELMEGDEVLIGHEMNVIVARSPYPQRRSGGLALFERLTSDGRMMIRHRDEPVLVDMVPALDGIAWKEGDLVRWDSHANVAFERIERNTGEDSFLEETPQESFECIGGLDAEIERLKETILLHLQHADVVRTYGLRPSRSVLLVGGPGTGKTMLARGLANWLARVSPQRRARFMNIKPAALHSMWYSQSEANYREAFRVARETGAKEPQVPVVLFFDEVDAVGAARGGITAHVDDRVLTAFMAELDGLESRGNVLVVAATNRVDALDPALIRPGRLGDMIVEIGRPRRSAARAIFGKHLGRDVPLAAEDGLASPERHERFIAVALSRIFSPNADNDLATLTFRDGRRRVLKPADLVSGACIASIVDSAKRQAVRRHLATNDPGMRLEDLLSAVDESFAMAARKLSPENCHKHLTDLPQDALVVRVDLVEQVEARRWGYFNAA